MPPLKSSAGFHEQRRSLDRVRTEDDLKRKLRSGSERSELINRHVSDKMLDEVKQLRLKKARLVSDFDKKFSHRPGATELILKNTLPVHSSIKRVIKETPFPKASGENSSCDEDSNDSLSPGQPVSQDFPLGPGPTCCSTEKLVARSVPSPIQVSSSGLPVQPVSSDPLNLSKPVQRTGATSHIKDEPELDSDRLVQKQKKTKDHRPKVKKFKYHQYIPPDQKGDKEPPHHLDSSYAKMVQQQQLILQLQILTQQQHKHQTIPSAPPDSEQKPSSSSGSTSSSPRPAAVASTILTNQHNHKRLSSAALRETKDVSVHQNLDGMKVAELKSELKLRGLPISGTRKGLIERLRIHQELKSGRDTTFSPTTGGTTEPGPERAGASSETSNVSQEQQLPCHRTSSVNGSSFSESAETPQQFLRRDATIKLLTPRSNSPDAVSPKDTTFKSSPIEEQMISPLPELSFQPSSVAQLPASIKEESPCSTPPPCQFSLKSASLHKHAPATPTAAPPVTVDKDRMLQEKDKQIAELTRLLRQKQRLVEELEMLLENGNREAPAPEQQIPQRVNEGPPDNFGEALSAAPPPLSPQTSAIICEMDVTKVIVKQEAVEAEICDSEESVRTACGLKQSVTQTKEVRDQFLLQLKPEWKSLQKKQVGVCLQQSALHLVQEQAIQKLLLQQQDGIQKRRNQTLHQQRQKKPPKLQLRRQEQHQQPAKLKQQVQTKQKHTEQLQRIQIQTEIHLKHQQVSESNLKQRSGSSSDLLQNNPKPTSIGRSSGGSHFLIPLTRHITRDQRKHSEGKAPNPIKLQTQQGAASPSLQPVISSPSPQTGTCSGLDVPLSPQSPDVIKTEASSPEEKDRDNEEDFIAVVLQAGELSTTLSPDPNPSLESPHPDSSPSLSPSPLQFLLSPFDPPSYKTLKPDPPAPLAQAETTEQKQHLSLSSSGRLEDFLEGITGKPLLGVEPGGLLTLIDDLHSQLLCTPSILDDPSAPMDMLDLAGEEGPGLDWLGFTVGGESQEKTPTLASLVHETPLSVFSADFLDSSDLHTHWDSCM